MDLNVLFLTGNDCFKAGAVLVPKGIMVHSTGANNPNLRRYVGPDDGKLGLNTYGNHWNQPRPDGQQKCVHAFIGKLANGAIATYQTLPWDMRGWHAGGSANNTHIGFEICEDALADPLYFERVYKEAVELTARLCGMFGLNPLTDGVVIDHSEGAARGIASNHSDVRNWFPKFVKGMDSFRTDVSKELKNGNGDALSTMSISVDGSGTKKVSSILRSGVNYPNLRELMDILGYSVGYEPNTKLVTLTKKA